MQEKEIWPIVRFNPDFFTIYQLVFCLEEGKTQLEFIRQYFKMDDGSFQYYVKEVRMFAESMGKRFGQEELVGGPLNLCTGIPLLEGRLMDLPFVSQLQLSPGGTNTTVQVAGHELSGVDSPTFGQLSGELDIEPTLYDFFKQIIDRLIEQDLFDYFFEEVALIYAFPAQLVERAELDMLPVVTAMDMTKEQHGIVANGERVDQVFLKALEASINDHKDSLSADQQARAEKMLARIDDQRDQIINHIMNDGPGSLYGMLPLAEAEAMEQDMPLGIVISLIGGTGENIAVGFEFAVDPTTRELLRDSGDNPIRRGSTQAVPENVDWETFVVNMEIGGVIPSEQTVADTENPNLGIEALGGAGVGWPGQFNRMIVMSSLSRMIKNIIMEANLDAYDISRLSDYGEDSFSNDGLIYLKKTVDIVMRFYIDEEDILEIRSIANLVVEKSALRMAQQLAVVSLETGLGSDSERLDAVGIEGSLWKTGGFLGLVKDQLKKIMESTSLSDEFSLDNITFVHADDYNATVRGPQVLAARHKADQIWRSLTEDFELTVQEIPLNLFNLDNSPNPVYKLLKMIVNMKVVLEEEQDLDRKERLTDEYRHIMEVVLRTQLHRQYGYEEAEEIFIDVLTFVDNPHQEEERMQTLLEDNTNAQIYSLLLLNFDFEKSKDLISVLTNRYDDP